VSESFSGPIAVSLAASGLPRLKGLVLCCTFVRNPQPIFGSLLSLLGMMPVTAVPVALLSWLLLGRFSSPALRSAFAKAVLGKPMTTPMRGAPKASDGTSLTHVTSGTRPGDALTPAEL